MCFFDIHTTIYMMNNKMKRTVAAIIAGLLILAMIIPMVLPYV